MNKGFGHRDIDRFNREVPRGTAVRFYPVLPERPGIEPLDTRTRSEAWALGHGDGVVLINGKAGGVSIAHVEVRP